MLAAYTLNAEQGILVVHVKDAQGGPVVGLEIGPEGDGSTAITLKGGIARISLARQTKAGSWVSLQVVTSPKGRDLVMISPWDGRALVPPFENESDNFVGVVVTERGDRAVLESGTVLRTLLETIVAKAKKSDQQDRQHPIERALDDVANKVGLPPPDVDKAIRAWGAHTEDSHVKSLLLDYRGNGVSNEDDLLVRSSALLVPFDVPKGAKLTITGLSSDNLVTVETLDPPTAFWSIVRDVKPGSSGSCGTVVASGTSPAKLDPTGMSTFGLSEYRLSAQMKIDLQPGRYWVKFVPRCTNPDNPACGNARYFLTQLELNSSSRIGTPQSCNDTYFEGYLGCHKVGARVGCVISSADTIGTPSK
jgi:hypothetical protein